jgi:hypothetical protein
VTSATGTLAVDAVMFDMDGVGTVGLLQPARPMPGGPASLPGRAERWGCGGHSRAPI